MRRLVLIAAVAVAAFTLSACGGASGSPSAPVATGLAAADLIAASADETAAAQTARISGEVTIDIDGKRTTLPLDGALDFESGAFAFTYDMGQLGLPGADGTKIDARMVDGVMYMNLGDLAGDGDAMAEMTGGKSWIKLDLESLGLDSSAAGGGLGEADPGGTLEALRGVGDVERVGTETLRGEETTHYRATVDPQKALAEIPAEQRARVERGLESLGGSLPVDVWIDGDGQTRKIAMDIDTGPAQVSTSIEYYDFGTDVDVSAPPAEDVFDLGDMFSGFPGLGGTAREAA